MKKTLDSYTFQSPPHDTTVSHANYRHHVGLISLISNFSHLAVLVLLQAVEIYRSLHSALSGVSSHPPTGFGSWVAGYWTLWFGCGYGCGYGGGLILPKSKHVGGSKVRAGKGDLICHFVGEYLGNNLAWEGYSKA